MKIVNLLFWLLGCRNSRCRNFRRGVSQNHAALVCKYFSFSDWRAHTVLQERSFCHQNLRVLGQERFCCSTPPQVARCPHCWDQKVLGTHVAGLLDATLWIEHVAEPCLWMSWATAGSVSPFQVPMFQLVFTIQPVSEICEWLQGACAEVLGQGHAVWFARFDHNTAPCTCRSEWTQAMCVQALLSLAAAWCHMIWDLTAWRNSIRHACERRRARSGFVQAVGKSYIFI